MGQGSCGNVLAALAIVSLIYRQVIRRESLRVTTPGGGVELESPPDFDPMPAPLVAGELDRAGAEALLEVLFPGRAAGRQRRVLGASAHADRGLDLAALGQLAVQAGQHGLAFGRGLDRNDADRFVGMYVNDYTLDFGDTGRRAVRELLERGHRAGVIPTLVRPEFVGTPGGS